jgi:hypothetical protein
MEQKTKLLYKAVSLIRARVEIAPLKYIEFLPISETALFPSPQAPMTVLMDRSMFQTLRNFMRGVTVLVTPTGKETVRIEEIEIHEL